MLLEIRYPVLAVVHFNVAVRVLFRLVKHGNIANLRGVGILRHDCCSVSQ